MAAPISGGLRRHSGMALVPWRVRGARWPAGRRRPEEGTRFGEALRALAALFGVGLALLPSADALAAEVDEVAAVLADEGVYVEAGSATSDLEEVVVGARAVGIRLMVAVVDEDPPAGASGFADAVLDRVGDGTVLVLTAPGFVGVSSTEFTQAELETALDAADAAGGDDVTYAASFAAALPAPPRAEPAGTTGGLADVGTAAAADALIATPPEFPTSVLIALGIVDIPRIDEREQLFMIDGRLFAFWSDPRLAFDAAAFGAPDKLYEGEAAIEKLKTEIWSPGFELTDGRGRRETISLAVSVDADGFVLYQERFLATVAQEYRLDEFPFDTHDISFTVEPFSQDTERIVFTSLEELAADLGEVLDEELDFGVMWESDEWAVDASEFTPDIVNDDSGFASATFDISISRNSSFYVTNIILPLILIVAISWAVFFMDFNNMNLAERLGVSITSLLTVVAFDFLTSDNLPKLPYATRLDTLYTISYVFVSITVFLSVVAYVLHRRGSEGAARLDKLGRWLFLAAYGTVVALALGGAIN